VPYSLQQHRACSRTRLTKLYSTSARALLLLLQSILGMSCLSLTLDMFVRFVCCCFFFEESNQGLNDASLLLWRETCLLMSQTKFKLICLATCSCFQTDNFFTFPDLSIDAEVKTVSQAHNVLLLQALPSGRQVSQKRPNKAISRS
jgi:hypothetical protein